MSDKKTDKKTLLMIAPAFDQASDISFEWYKNALKHIPKDKFNIITLEKEEATRENFEKYIKDADIFAFWDHGNTNLLGSQQGKNPPLVDFDNDYLLKDKEVWTMACLSGMRLGPDVVKKGGALFQGYRFPFVFTPYPVIKDIFGKSANKGFLSRVVDDKDISKCEEEQRLVFKKNILKLMAIPVYGMIFAVFLSFDLVGLVYIQEESN